MESGDEQDIELDAPPGRHVGMLEFVGIHKLQLCCLVGAYVRGRVANALLPSGAVLLGEHLQQTACRVTNQVT